MEELGAYVGLKSGSARTLIPGMIWGTDTKEGQEILAKLDEIQKQLDCIDAKINYVIAQVSALQVQLSMTAAENCYNNAISTNWSNYLAYTVLFRFVWKVGSYRHRILEGVSRQV